MLLSKLTHWKCMASGMEYWNENISEIPKSDKDIRRKLQTNMSPQQSTIKLDPEKHETILYVYNN